MLDYAAIVSTPLADVKLGIRQAEGAICAIDFLPACAGAVAPQTPLAGRAVDALRRYFEDPRHPFSLPLNVKGTPFQQGVWQALTQLPPGRTLSYGELARRLGTAARAVGNACRANPVPLVIPCHRVVAAAGLGGYAGQVHGRQLEIKRWLLEHEGRAAA